MSRILALDPGPTLTAWLVLDGTRAIAFGHEPNAVVLERVRGNEHACHEIAIEMIASYGMAVGAEVFQTCLWIGRFVEAWTWGGTDYGGGGERPRPRLVFRREVKLHLCGQARAKDPNVRQAILDLYGGKDAAMGRKAAKGPLYGVSGDVWSALAVAITARDTVPQNAGAA